MLPRIISIETVGFFFHHIYNAGKKKFIVQHAKECNLTGFYRYGKPGRIVVEGLQKDVRSYVAEIKQLRWQQCVVRSTRVKEVPFDGDLEDSKAVQKAIDSHRVFHSFEQCNDDSDLHLALREHGCEDLFYEMTGFKPRK